jgi:WD40 repeat protein
MFSSDGQLLESGFNDRTVQLWDANTGECRGMLKGHSDWVSTVVFSSDGQLLASGSLDRTVRLWDVKTGNTTHIFERGRHDEVSFTSDGLFNVGRQQVNLHDLQLSTTFAGQIGLNHPYTLDVEGQWVTRVGAKFLWIPPECRPGVYAVRGNTIVIGNGSGRMTFCQTY